MVRGNRLDLIPQHMKEIEMSALLASLKIVQAKRLSITDPIEFRRQKLIRKIDEQIQLAHAVQNGTAFVVQRQRKVIDEVTGGGRSITVERSVRPMWFTSRNGKKVLQLRYGSKVIELAKGKNAIEVNDDKSLVEVLQTVRVAIDGGELDVQIGTASDSVKARFKK
jgi:hypothetical protein